MGDMYCCPFANTLFHFLCQFPSGLGPAALSPIFWQHPATSTTKLAGQSLRHCMVLDFSNHAPGNSGK